jgi:hypothetical protein
VNTIIAKTFGGLSAQYYFRQFIFGLALTAFILFALSKNPQPMPYGMYVLLAVNTLLYPYARFVYEGVIGFIMGQNTFYLNALIMLVFKVMTMAMCWSFSVFIAPIGLVYLYIYHSKVETA